MDCGIKNRGLLILFFGCARELVGVGNGIISYKMQSAACFLWKRKFCILWAVLLFLTPLNAGTRSIKVDCCQLSLVRSMVCDPKLGCVFVNRIRQKMSSSTQYILFVVIQWCFLGGKCLELLTRAGSIWLCDASKAVLMFQSFGTEMMYEFDSHMRYNVYIVLVMNRILECSLLYVFILAYGDLYAAVDIESFYN